MNSTSNNMAAVAIIIVEYYEIRILACVIISSLALSFFDYLLNFSREIEYIWFKPFSLPTWLYIFARYGFLIYRGLQLSLNLASLERLANASDSIGILVYIGVEGLLVARAYSMCRANKILTTALLFGLLSGFITRLYGSIAVPGCIVKNTTEIILLVLVDNIIVLYTDVLIFGIIMWNVFGIWKLKRETGIQSNRDLVSVLFSQSTSRICFVIILSVASAAIAAVPYNAFVVHSQAPYLVRESFGYFQNALSSILVANFTLDLRELNSAKIEASNLSLPSLRFSNVLQHVHRSLVVELANPEELIADNLEGGDREDIPRTTDDMEIQPARD